MRKISTSNEPKLLPYEIQSKFESNFPSSRYFQIHFEELHLQLFHTQKLVEQLNIKINQLESKLTGNCKLP